MLLHTADAEKRDAIFVVKGSLAAAIDEKCWEKLLKGEAVGVIEPDINRWSLYVDGMHVKTYLAGDLQAAISKVFKEHDFLDDWVKDGNRWAKTREGVEPKAEIINGYPYLMCLTPEALQRYEWEGVDAKTMAERMRTRLKHEYTNLHRARKAKNVNAIDILGAQIHLYGMTREGRD